MITSLSGLTGLFSHLGIRLCRVHLFQQSNDKCNGFAGTTLGLRDEVFSPTIRKHENYFLHYKRIRKNDLIRASDHKTEFIGRHTINQSINQTFNARISRPTNQSINQSIERAFIQLKDKSTNQSINRMISSTLNYSTTFFHHVELKKAGKLLKKIDT